MKTMLLLASLFSLLFLFQVTIADSDDSIIIPKLHSLPRVKRVIGGDVIKNVKNWPFLANLDGKFCSGFWFWRSCTHTYCGGSLINKRWVLTAAHCMKHEQAKTGNNWHIKLGEEKFELSTWERFVAWFGRSTGNSNAYQKIHGEKVIVHEQYQESNRWKNDIALIKLANDAPINRVDIGPVTLPQASVGQSWPEDDALCIMKGWGCTKQGGRSSDVARAVGLKKNSDAECNRMWGYNKAEFSQTRLCAGQQQANNDQGICSGDSGGPLVCKKDGRWIQAGIASFTGKNNPGKVPGVFTRVSSYIDWINKKIQNN